MKKIETVETVYDVQALDLQVTRGLTTPAIEEHLAGDLPAGVRPRLEHELDVRKTLKLLAKAFHDGQNALDRAVNAFLKTGESTFSLAMAKELKSDYMALKGANDNAARQMLMTVRKRLEKAGIVIEKSARGGANNAGKVKTHVAPEGDAAKAEADKKGVTAKTLTLAPTDSAAIKQVRGLFAQFSSKWAPDELAALMDDLDVLAAYVAASALNTK